MARLPLWSRDLSTAARALLGAASLALASLGALGCGDPPAPIKKGPLTAADPAEQGRLEQGRKKIDDANRDINEKKFDHARKLLKEAAELGVESQSFEVEAALEKVDKRQAKQWANEVSDTLKEKDCLPAFKQLAVPLKQFSSETFTREIRRLVGPDGLKCLQGVIDDKVMAGGYSDARKLVDGPDVKAVLGPTASKKLATELEATILDALKGQIADELKARRWSQAVDKIDAAVKKGDATDDQAAALFAAVREGIGPEIAAAAQKALGQRDSAQTLKQIDAQIKLVRWELLTGDAAALAKERTLPEDIAKKREALAIWVEAQRLSLKLLKTPEKRWTHGKVAVNPAAKIDAASRRDIPHGTAVWILGTTKDGKALLTDSDPGTGPTTGMLDKVVGWAKADGLAKEATLDWVVPDDQLKGERVWAPLRKDEPTWELGTVTEVTSKDISVKRLADDAVIKVTRKQLRNGRLSPGTRVITFCTAKDQPAKIQEVVAGTNVKLKCDSGEEKEEVLASLRSKPDILPPSK